MRSHHVYYVTIRRLGRHPRKSRFGREVAKRHITVKNGTSPSPPATGRLEGRTVPRCGDIALVGCWLGRRLLLEGSKRLKV